MTTATATPVKTRPATRPAKGKEPTFEDLVPVLANAEAKAKLANGESKQANAERSQAAVNLIRAAYSEKIDAEDVRKALLGGAVLKGTASKAATVVRALADKVIGIGDVKSLNHAYSAVKQLEKIARAGGTSAGTPTTPYSAPVAPAIASVSDAIKFLTDTIAAVTDPDEAFKIGGDLITKITNAITAELKKRDTDDE